MASHQHYNNETTSNAIQGPAVLTFPRGCTWHHFPFGIIPTETCVLP